MTSLFTYKNSSLATAFFIGAMILLSCKTGQPTQSGSYRQLYDFDSQALHPEYILYHYSDDSSMVHFKIKSSNLLYTRLGAGNPFEAKVKLQIISFDRQADKKDTTEIILKDSEQKSDSYLLSSMKFPLSEGSYNLILNFTDINRNSIQTHYLRADKRDRMNAQNFLLIDGISNEPCFGGFVATGKTINVKSERNQWNLNQIAIYKMSGEIKLPPPPFSTNQPELPSFNNAVVIKTNTQDNKVISFNVDEGMYLITTDPNKINGLALSTTSNFYPMIEHTDQLPWPLRYITTKAEYDEIIKSNYSKTLIDNFWIECAGNKERARDLIRIYYSRVEEANIFFNTYTEGWRTDRGMMHIVFGNPTKIIKQEDSETWIYGEEGQIGMLSFGFKKQENPFNNNVYFLNRDPMFKSHWERMVTTWRNGKVFNE